VPLDVVRVLGGAARVLVDDTGELTRRLPVVDLEDRFDAGTELLLGLGDAGGLANGKDAKPPALTTDGSAAAAGITMRVLADPGANNGGWILHAAWPV